MWELDKLLKQLSVKTAYLLKNKQQMEMFFLGVFPWGGNQSEGTWDPGHDR